MGYIEAARIMREMKGQKYIAFMKNKDAVILDDDFTIEQLEAIITTMKGML